MKLMTNSIDLRTCKPGQKLRSKHGLILTYSKYSLDDYYPHEVIYPNGSRGTRINDGHVFYKNRMKEDHDIVEILPIEN